MLYHWIINNYRSLSDLLFYIYIFVIILVYIHAKYNREKYINNWDNYKCKAYIIPISGLINGDKSLSFFQSTFSNLNGCFWGMIQRYFNILTKPFVYIISLFKSLLTNLIKHIDVL